MKLIERFEKYLTNNEGGIIDHPIRYIEDWKLPRYLKPLYEKLDGLISEEELEESAKLAKRDHLITIGQHVDGVNEAEKRSLDIQRSAAFWREPKELLLTLSACCLASMTRT